MGRDKVRWLPLFINLPHFEHCVFKWHQLNVLDKVFISFYYTSIKVKLILVFCFWSRNLRMSCWDVTKLWYWLLYWRFVPYLKIWRPLNLFNAWIPVQRFFLVDLSCWIAISIKIVQSLKNFLQGLLLTLCPVWSLYCFNCFIVVISSINIWRNFYWHVLFLVHGPVEWVFSDELTKIILNINLWISWVPSPRVFSAWAVNWQQGCQRFSSLGKSPVSFVSKNFFCKLIIKKALFSCP